MANVLLVLGNGFDLLCGLKSSFSQYLSSVFNNPIMEKLRRYDVMISDCLKETSSDDVYSIYDKKNKIVFDNYTTTFAH